MRPKTACLAALLAGAGLGANCASHAQSSVTFYGSIDVSVETHTNAPDGAGGSKSATGMRSGGQSGSRFGLRGVEDLGGGLKAVFNLEAGFNATSGMPSDATRLFHRTAMVGVQGKLGQISFGRQYTSGFRIMSLYVPGSYGVLYEPTGRMFPSRADNSILYSGKFGKTTVDAYYAFRNIDEQTQFDAGATGSFGGALAYTFSKNVGAMVAYDRLEAPANRPPFTPPGVTGGTGHNAFVGARWDIGTFRMLGGYRYRNVENSGTGQRDLESDLYMLGLVYRVSPAVGLKLTYHHEEFKNAPRGYLGMRSSSWKQVALLATYNLSKRTNIYLAAAHARDGALNLGYSGDRSSYVLAPGKSSQSGVAIGIGHLF